ncbi:putative F-box/LRR-repeat protein At3g18150 [Euphorbia lathyris]|uniref:putative F-box/LRR-repeat protein At3g18150 n=1 Tax=Euphorbia lathyris TaxID=212925 RepID=UPI0033144529
MWYQGLIFAAGVKECLECARISKPDLQFGATFTSLQNPTVRSFFDFLEKQWTYVPVLIFDSSGTSFHDISRIIDNTLILHDCSKIKKFHIKSRSYSFTEDSNSIAKLRFALRKEVEELILHFEYIERFLLPNFFFINASLVKLHVDTCILKPNGRINWPHLKNLSIEGCWCPNQAIETAVSGSPLLESLKINFCDGFDQLVIASKSLKILVLADMDEEFVLTISCPNLVEFCAFKSSGTTVRFCLSDGAIENVLSGSPLLELLELIDCEGFKLLVINSNSLKRLVLVGIPTDAIIISCPNLEELNLHSLYIKTIELINLPSSICATLDFDFSEAWYGENLGRMILEQFHNVKELKIGPCFIKRLSTMEMRGLSCPSLNNKCLTFDGGPNFVEHLRGIAYALRSSPELEKLVITLRLIECSTDEDLPNLNVSAENYWNTNGIAFNCLVSHLKIVKIMGLSEKDDKLNPVLNFVEFLLKNGRVLEKMVVVLEDGASDFLFKVSQKLLDFPRYSKYAIVELLCSKLPSISKYSKHVV